MTCHMCSSLRALVLLVITMVTSACMERQPAEFEAPQIGVVRVEAEYEAVHFDVAVRGDFRDCGVYFGGSAETLRAVAGTRTENGFSVTVEGLEDGADYCWKAFLGNGREEVCSALAQVSTPVSPFVKMPDPVFRAWVVEHYDIDKDGYISQQEAQIITSIECTEGGGAMSLKGIESFPNLKKLIWENGQLMSVDLSGNAKLEELSLANNLLTAVDLSSCPRLQYLQCYGNHLSSLNLSVCPSLKLLLCWFNDLTALDVTGLPELEDLRCAQNDFSSAGLDLSGNPKLRILYCNETRLQALDVSANPRLEELGCYDNPLEDMLDLTANPRLDTLKITGCPNLDEVWLKTGHTVRRGIEKDENTRVYYTASSPLVNIQDPAFKAYLIENFDQDGDGELSRKEAAAIRNIGVCSDERNIRSLQGIERMPNLQILQCMGSWIDGPVPEQPYYYQGHYRWPNCFGPAGTLLDVDVSHNPALQVLHLGGNAGLGDNMETLDLRNNLELVELGLGMTYLNYPDVSFLTSLEVLDLSHLRGTKPDISRLTKLRQFMLDHPQDDGSGYPIDVSHCPDLEVLHIATAGSVSDLSKNPKLVDLRVGHMQLTSLDITSLHELDYLNCAGNRLTELDLSGNPKLRELECLENRITTLDVSANPALEKLWAAPMNNEAGENLLKTLYVAAGQEIPGVTKDRDAENFPPETEIIVK